MSKHWTTAQELERIYKVVSSMLLVTSDQHYYHPISSVLLDLHNCRIYKPRTQRILRKTFI